MQRQPRSCNNIPSFLQWTAPIARYFCVGCTWHHLHILVKASLCCDWKSRAASAQSFTLWHQVTVKIPRRAQHWEPFFNLSGAISLHVGHHILTHWAPNYVMLGAISQQKNVEKTWDFVWLDTDSSLQTNDSKWLDSSRDSTLTRPVMTLILTQLEKILYYSDSTLTRRACDSDSTLTRQKWLGHITDLKETNDLSWRQWRN